MILEAIRDVGLARLAEAEEVWGDECATSATREMMLRQI
jgi:hypothetical protein